MIDWKVGPGSVDLNKTQNKTLAYPWPLKYNAAADACLLILHFQINMSRMFSDAIQMSENDRLLE